MKNRSGKFISIVLICTFFSPLVSAQIYLPDPVTQLKNNTADALYPFAGGLNNPQFNDVDLNVDGIKDLVIFDRNGGKVITLKNNGTPGAIDYTFAPLYEDIFPPMKYWMVLADLNCDGVEDLFTANESNVKFYKAVVDASGLHYNLVTEKVQYHEAGFTFDLGVGIIDIPGFADVNGDGDLDILTFNLSGGVVDYFENMRIEDGLSCDSIYFDHVNGCWGNFFETALKKSVDLGVSCKGISSGKTEMLHAGSTFMCYDEDADNDIDIVLGDLAFGNLNRLLNGGDNTEANITEQDTTFPKYDVPYQLDIFPSPFLIDVNNDEKEDMLVAPNKEGISENFKNVWYYKNTSPDAAYVFNFQNDSLFVSDMVDVGEGARAVFFDYDQDGLQDIVIGNLGYYNSGSFISKLALYRNTGTATAPEFTLITRDYAGLSFYGLRNLAPAFGDLDGDGDDDMLIGDNNGNLHFFRNSAAPGATAIFSSLTEGLFEGIDVGINATPQLVDVNEDGLLDLVIGEQNGNLNYYIDTGTVTLPGYKKISELWGNVDVRVAGSLTGHSAPFLTKQDGVWKLYVGCEDGTIVLYEPAADFTGAFTKITTTFSNIDEGSFSSVQLMDITADDTLEMLTANQRGGITLYRDSRTLDPVEKEWELTNLAIFPNPAQDAIYFSVFPQNIFSHYRIYDIAGKLLQEGSLPGTSISIERLQQGIYIIQFVSDRHFYITKKFIKI